jgi:uncharacterized membrane protein
MKMRFEIKAQAMARFKERYWPVVGIGALGLVITYLLGIVPYIGGLASLLVGSVITVGLTGFYLRVYRGETVATADLFSPFNRYGRVLGGMLWMYLWLFLWALLYIVPIIIYFTATFVFPTVASLYDTGLMPDFTFSPAAFWLLLPLLIPVAVKAFSYFLTPYILADSPGVMATDALALSKKMMRGHKWTLFVANLSFLGWFAIVVAATAAVAFFCIHVMRLDQAVASVVSAAIGYIPYVFFIGPYYQSAMAGYYEEIKEKSKAMGLEGTQTLR